VKPSGLACELVVWIATDSPRISAGTLDRQFARTPYACSFVTTGANPTTFILVMLHVDWGKKAADRIPELRAIAEWLAGWAEQEDDWNHNKAFTSTGLEPPPGIADVPRTIFRQTEEAPPLRPDRLVQRRRQRTTAHAYLLGRELLRLRPRAARQPDAEHPLLAHLRPLPTVRRVRAATMN